MEKQADKTRNKTVSTTFVIVMLALIAVTTATIAWFSIADNTRLSSMRMDITSGKSLRFDLDPHLLFDDYVISLGFDDIAARILKDQNIDITKTALMPVTTEDGVNFFYENGDPAKAEDIIEFTLHFVANTDMTVHLTSENSKNGTDGTRISSDNPETPLSMRIAFIIDGECYVYDPGMDGQRENKSKMSIFGLYSADKMQYNSTNALFKAPQNVNIPVIVRIWLEGTDEACKNEIKNSDYEIRLRFEGTDENNNKIN